MADSVDLGLNLIDGVTGPSKKMARALKAQAKLMQRIQSKTEKADRQISQVRKRRELKDARDRGAALQSNIGLMKKAALVAAAMGTALVAGAAVGARELLRTAASASQLRYSLDRLTHGKGAQDLRDVSELAANLGLNVEDTAHQYEKLLKLQFSRGDAKTWVTFGADMQALGNSAEDVEGILLAISQIKSKGKLQGEEALQLAERGVSIDLVNQEIAKSMGVDQKQVAKLQKAGKVTADIALAAIQEALKRKLNETRPGEAAEDFIKKTFAGNMSQTEKNVERVGLGLGAAFSSGFEKQQERALMLQGLGVTTQHSDTSKSALDRMADSPGIAKLGAVAEMLGRLFQQVLPPAIDVLTAAIEGFAAGFGFEGGEDAGVGFAKMMKEDIAPAMREVGWLIGMTTKVALALAIGFTYAAIKITAFVSSMVQGVGEAFTFLAELPGKALDIGKRIIDGLIQGIKDGAVALKQGVTTVAGNVISWASDKLDINSPSKEFAYLGEMSMAGFQVGLDSRKAALPAASAMVPDGAGARGGSSINVGGIVIEVHSSGDPQEVARATFAEFQSNFAQMMLGFAGEPG